jgi:hypothetical protein
MPLRRGKQERTVRLRDFRNSPEAVVSERSGSAPASTVSLAATLQALGSDGFRSSANASTVGTGGVALPFCSTSSNATAVLSGLPLGLTGAGLTVGSRQSRVAISG